MGHRLLGALVGYYVSVPSRVVAGVMAFGAGVLISALSFELMDEAYDQAGLAPTATLLVGGWAFMAATGLLIAEVDLNTACVLDRDAVSISAQIKFNVIDTTCRRSRSILWPRRRLATPARQRRRPCFCFSTTAS